MKRTSAPRRAKKPGRSQDSARHPDSVAGRSQAAGPRTRGWPESARQWKARWLPVRVLDRYLLRELVVTLLMVFVVLTLVSLGGLVADLLGKIARGKLPAALLVSQLGLRAVGVLPLLLPLSLFLAVLLALGRLYRDSEMVVLAAAGAGLRQLARPFVWVVLPVIALVGVCSLWAAPAALRLSAMMIESANRSLLVAGLEPGRFVELPGRTGVVYLAEMSADGSRFERLFVHSERDGRIDVVTARAGELFEESEGGERYLSLYDGFRVEGVPGQRDYRMMRFARNDIRVPDAEPGETVDGEARLRTLALLGAQAPAERAELHWRLGAPIAALVLAVLAVPLSRAPPRTSRHGRLLVALLGYIVYLNMLMLGQAWLASGAMPAWLGLWWVHLPVLAIALILLQRDRRLKRPSAA